jgi:gluconolactonase
MARNQTARLERSVLAAAATSGLLIAALAVGSNAASPVSMASTAPAASTAVGTPAPTAAPVSAVTMDSLIAPGAKLETFAKGLEFAEGPLWLPGGRLITSDVYGDVVYAFDATGTRVDLRRPSNHANGHALAPDGSVVQAEHGDATARGRITRLSASGPDTVLADAFEGKRFNSPNDLIVKNDGTIWFTDPDYGQLFFPSEIGFYGVYRLDPASGVVALLTAAIDEPNGIAFSPDERTLYVSATSTGLITAFPVNDDGTIGEGRRFGPGCDGIGVDERGNVWATSCGTTIDVTDPNGTKIGAVRIPGATSNLAWGGADGLTLFVTTYSGSVYSLRLTVGETPGLHPTGS